MEESTTRPGRRKGWATTLLDLFRSKLPKSTRPRPFVRPRPISAPANLKASGRTKSDYSQPAREHIVARRASLGHRAQPVHKALPSLPLREDAVDIIEDPSHSRIVSPTQRDSYRAQAQAELVLLQARLARTLLEADEVEAARIKEQILRDEQTARDIRRDSILRHEAQDNEDEEIARVLQTVLEEADEERTSEQLSRDAALASVLQAYLEDTPSERARSQSITTVSTAGAFSSTYSSALSDLPGPSRPPSHAESPATPGQARRLVQDEEVSRNPRRKSSLRSQATRVTLEDGLVLQDGQGVRMNGTEMMEHYEPSRYPLTGPAPSQRRPRRPRLSNASPVQRNPSHDSVVVTIITPPNVSNGLL